MLLGTIAELVSLGMILPFLGVLTNADQVFEHAWIQPLILFLGITQPSQLLLPLTVLFGIGALFAGIIRLTVLWGQMYLGNAVGTDIGTFAFRRTLYQSYNTHMLRGSDEVIAALTVKLNNVVYAAIIPALTLLTSVLTIFAILAFLVVLDPKLTITIFFIFGVLYFLIVLGTQSKLVQDSKTISIGQNRLTRLVQESLGSIRHILIDGLQESYTCSYERIDKKLRKAYVSIHVLAGMPRPVIETLGLVVIAALVYSQVNAQTGILSALPMLGAFALAAQRLLPLVQQGYSGITYLRGSQDSLRDVLTLLEQSLPSHDTSSKPTRLIQFVDRINLVDVNFNYTSSTPLILCGVNIEINRGNRIGFIGPTGSGKSTLLDIIMGLLIPTSGIVKINNISLNEKNLHEWQKHIAHVPQTIYLLNASIAENIAFGIQPESIDYMRVRKVAEKAKIADTIESWPDGYDSSVGELGVRLSGGQRQRIGIARALYKQAEVIVFDEATSALDSETERMVMESIEAIGKNYTVLIVAHRISTLKRCDYVIELKNGGIAQVTSYDKLEIC